MSLDGLRAWIGEVERKLGMRTRVFLALAAIAVGGAGAAIYLAIDAQDNSVSKADLQSVRNELAGAVGGSLEGAGDTAGLEAEVRALQEEVAALRAEEGTAEKGNGEGAAGSTGGITPSGGSTPETQKQLKEAIEQAEEQAGK